MSVRRLANRKCLRYPLTMCGIAGYGGLEPSPDLLARMTRSIHHRGPDDEGSVTSGKTGIAMRRLSIIDVKSGKQPIHNSNHSRSIVFNGEIYNYPELREELVKEGYPFQTRSDTEVILALYEKWGEKCVDKLRGMFTFAIVDRDEESLFIARDRLGVKPLYYWNKNGVFLFASEIKALLEHPLVAREVDLSNVDSYLSLRYVPGPGTLFKGVEKFPAAHTMRWKDGKLTFNRYWAPRFNVAPVQTEKDAYYEERFAELFEESVKIRLLSEVPVGAYLSGGTDSTAIVAAMSKLTNTPVRTFSVGFNWAGDELSAARQTAERLGTIHEEIACEPKDLRNLPKAIWHLDEPVGDAIVIPMYLLSQAAKRSVTVVLTGEGADEGLAGYLPHKILLWARLFQKWIPPMVRERIKPLILKAPSELLSLAFSYPSSLGKRGQQKLFDYMGLLENDDLKKEYEFLLSLFDPRHKNELYSPHFKSRLKNSDLDYSGTFQFEQSDPDTLHRILALQYSHWLPDDILMKQDKMTMANSIEARVPFLDHHLVEFLATVPTHLKLKGLTDKVLLRRYLKSNLPGKAANRPKKPFYIPIDGFFEKGPLKEMADACLNEDSIKKRGYFDWNTVRFLLENRNEKDFMIGKQLFSILCLEIWHRIFIDQEKGWV